MRKRDGLEKSGSHCGSAVDGSMGLALLQPPITFVIGLCKIMRVLT